MPDIVLRHKDKTIRPFVFSVPYGVDPKQAAAVWEQRGWSVDEKTRPADLEPTGEKELAAALRNFEAGKEHEPPAEPVATTVDKSKEK